MDLEKVSNLIKNKRKEKGLTQEELAQKLNVTEKAISRWETGRGTPDISLLIPLSNELGVSVSEILSGHEDEKSNDSVKEIIEYIDVNKRTKNIKALIVSVIIYTITLIFYLSYLRIEYDSTSTFEFSYLGEIVFNSIFAILIIIANKIIANYYCDKVVDKNKMKKTSYFSILILYVIMIFNLAIFRRLFDGIRYNLIPFKTILDYFINFHKYNLRYFIINTIGNILTFMPVQYLIIKIFNLKKLKSILFIDIVILFVIEFSQFITHTGVFDIDDIILNLFGMLLVYFVMYKLDKKTS